MNPTKLKKTLKSGGRVFGCMLSAMSSLRFESALAGSSLDFCVIDTEHGSRDRTEVHALCTMLRHLDITPIVRVPVPKAEWVAIALDAGAAGVLVPYCETVEEVSAVVATAKWHPLKGAYLRRAVEEGKFPSAETKRYLRKRRKDSFVIIGIESEPAHRNLQSILDVGDIDALFVGPNDLSTSLGVPDDYDSERYQSTVKSIIEQGEARGIPTMVHQQSIATSTMAIELGARFVMHSTDARLLQRIWQEDFKALREAAGVAATAAKDKVEIA